MLFTSPIFLQLFLPVVLCIYFLLHRITCKNIFLLLASLFFYTWGEPRNVLLLLGAITINYLLARFGLSESQVPKIRKLTVSIGILLNLLFLGTFKYTSPSVFFLDSIFDFPFRLKQIGLPLGISFYTFQIISYLIDTYRKENLPQKNLLDLALYITFFPQLVAGPIVKYHDISKYLYERKVSFSDLSYGIRRFVYGLSKKVLIANNVAYLADDIFQIPLTQLDMKTAWLGVIAYSLQIYFDFSGYSDMAIGLGRMFGFHFLENFNYPYYSKSMQEFWRRWHISLSTWFKEYVYIPLGGSRGSLKRTCLNIMIVFFATGCWHGAGLNFIVWGIYYGILLVLERCFLKSFLEKPAFSFFAHFYTLLLVIFGWVLFRAENLPDACVYSWKMLSFQNNPELPLSTFLTKWTVLLICISILFSAPLQMLLPKLKRYLYSEEIHGADFLLIPFLLILSIVMLTGNTYNPFIYFRF